MDLQNVVIALVSFMATLVGTMGGGGSSMIACPFFLMLGFPLPVVISSNSINGSLWGLIAARNYLRGHQLDCPLMFSLATFGLAGAFFGTKVILAVDVKLLQRVIGAVILALVALYFFKKSFGLHAGPVKLNRLQTGVLAFPLGFYEAFFGSGNGIFTSAILTSARGFVLLEALGYYYLIGSVWCIFASAIYVASGNYDLKLILPALCGSIAGASVGSRIGKKRGASFVKPVFIIVGSILGTKLLLGL